MTDGEHCYTTSLYCSVAVDGSGNSFQFYTSGVYGSSQCSSKKLNHALLLVGYGTTIDGQDYWIVKNRYVCSLAEVETLREPA